MFSFDADEGCDHVNARNLLRTGRTFEQVDDALTGWTHDSLNRPATQYGGGQLRFAGTVSEPATVTVDGVMATVNGANAFEAGVSVNTGTPIVSVEAIDPSGNATTAAFEVDVVTNEKTRWTGRPARADEPEGLLCPALSRFCVSTPSGSLAVDPATPTRQVSPHPAWRAAVA